MKNLDYMTAKWEKRKAVLIENSKYDYDEVDSLKRKFNDGNVDEIRYHYTLSLFYKNIAENVYVQNGYVGCYQEILNALNEFVISVKLLREGKSTNQATITNIENKINSGYFGYYALLTSNYDVIPNIVKTDSSIVRMLSKKEIDESPNDMIRIMENAISLNDSKMFEDALVNRIKAIRKFNLDNYVCADFVAMALVKEAKKVGMNFYSEYVEVDMKEI